MLQVLDLRVGVRVRFGRADCGAHGDESRCVGAGCGGDESRGDWVCGVIDHGAHVGVGADAHAGGCSVDGEREHAGAGADAGGGLHENAIHSHEVHDSGSGFVQHEHARAHHPDDSSESYESSYAGAGEDVNDVQEITYVPPDVHVHVQDHDHDHVKKTVKKPKN